ncbi:hypothetical protein LIER_24317 [Lithospermum erythrorhizon]|uniref:Reverse transcriptase domain-containing protein n=1 Tax=Lithospermum erythrorhizon TaxID=34254 RepID=A0AAV3R3Y0_LITER
MLKPEEDRKCRVGKENKQQMDNVHIGRLVDGSAGHVVFYFMDASRGYHQIRMKLEDAENTVLITKYGLYYCKVMSFGLKNSGATYQRMVNSIFAHQIG